MYECIQIHQKIITAEIRPLHEELVASIFFHKFYYLYLGFNKNFAEELLRNHKRPLKARDYGSMIKPNSTDNTKHLSSKSKNSIFTLDGSDDLGYPWKYKEKKRYTALESLCIQKSFSAENDNQIINKDTISSRNSIKQSVLFKSLKKIW